jgi:hypothetical protein
MKIDPTKSAVQNLLALIDASNAQAPNLPNEVTVSAVTTGSFPNGADTKVTLTGTGPQGSYANFTGSVDVTYKRLTLAAEAASPAGPVPVQLGTSKAATLAAVSQYFGFIPSEISAPSFTPQGTAGNQTVTLQASGSLIYEDGSTNITVAWQPPKTVLLMHFEGSNGSTVFTDAAGHPMTPGGSAQLTTNSPLIGTSSYTSNDALSYVTTPDAPELELTGDFTIEFFLALASTTTPQVVFSKGTGSYIDHYNGQFYVSLGSTNSPIIQVTSNVVAGTRYHVAITKHGTTVTLWLNGVSLATATSSLPFGQNTNALCVGNWTNGLNLGLAGGKMDEVRVSNVARYTSAFTAPTTPFTLD